MAATRQPDVLAIERIAESGERTLMRNFTSLAVTTDITMPSEASFELGGDGTFDSLEDWVKPGAKYQITVNDRPRLSGRIEMNDIPFDAGAGAVVRFTVRTKLSDAMYAGAGPNINIKKTTIKDFILQLYEPLGYTEDDFYFEPATSRDLLTGLNTVNRGTPIRVDLEAIKEDQAKVRPPETIYGAADRHLRRHGLIHWDAPDGRIVVGSPNDVQKPTFFFNMFKDERSITNNVLSATRTQDWSSVPSALGVYGVGGGRDFTKSKVGAIAQFDDVSKAGFYRPTFVVAEGIKTQELARRAAFRELSARSKSKDAYVIEVDGFSSWDGQLQYNYGHDCVAEIRSDVAGGFIGSYYIHACTIYRDAQGGDRTNLTLIRKGLWVL